MFKELFREYTSASYIFGDGCVNFKISSSANDYAKAYKSILVSDLLGNIYNRLIDSKQMTPEHLKFILTKPFPSIDKEQAIKNIKAFYGQV